MAIKFVCPSCKSNITTPDEYAGKKGKCPRCGGQVWVPEESLADKGDIAPIQIGHGPQPVFVVDFDMPIGSMVTLMLKWAIASIPAVLILAAILWAFSAIMTYVLGGFRIG
jgi:hypothetical protein